MKLMGRFLSFFLSDRYMERGLSYRQADIITNEVYRGLVEGRSYDDCLKAAYSREDFND